MKNTTSTQPRPLDLALIDDFRSDYRVIGSDHATAKDVAVRVTIDAATRRVVKIETLACS